MNGKVELFILIHYKKSQLESKSISVSYPFLTSVKCNSLSHVIGAGKNYKAKGMWETSSFRLQNARNRKDSVCFNF